eukprot:CAMPEP_0203967676 /NCGR_PEP_ID=MMETSP0359-20131031/96565_1 /ASSEMBLY_ACC=CAM_ASM_000338 /TAXON_ID=268821 /ORGANISM="Scrippsiella Hangoei, Strain SHTV-5" /LENGTH=467 /DNA_ID=CAMNT_0050905593 /DNA_START=64 /DNA_END=1467 /DNA_ORIENTATION=+
MAVVTRNRRWQRAAAAADELPPSDIRAAAAGAAAAVQEQTPPPPPPPLLSAAMGAPRTLGRSALRAAKGPSYVVQHYHSTGCAGGAFSWRAATLDPQKPLLMCLEAREYRETTQEDVARSKDDKHRGGGPRVGPFQETIPGTSWQALPKYDFTSRARSCAFNERMHVEWENHADHILKNGGELPTASVVAKAGFRSCAPCCRDMLAIARPTGKTFIMVDLADDDARGTFHFVAGGQYLPVPKEACDADEVAALKKIVSKAQDNGYESGAAIVDEVCALGVPIDMAARALYLGDAALLPEGCAERLKGNDLLEVLHAEHFARLTAEYGASILRDAARPAGVREAVARCRERAKAMLVAAWAPHLAGVEADLQAYADAAVSPLLPEDPAEYECFRRSLRPFRVVATPALTAERLQAIGARTIGGKLAALPSKWKKRPPLREEDSMSTITTAVPDDAASRWSDSEDPTDV